MMRQCAWCLRLIDSVGERVSQRPLPKLYEASHGMCCICGARWMEEVMKPLGVQGTTSDWRQNEVDSIAGVGTPQAEPSSVTSETVARLVFELQRQEKETGTSTHIEQQSSLSIT